jgi:hypothetical protein
VFSRHIVTFVLLVGILHLIPVAARTVVYSMRGWGRLADVVVSGGFSSLAQALVVFATFQELRGKPVTARESAAYALRRLLPLAILSLAHSLLFMLGLLLCVAPGLFTLSATAVALPACVVERLGPIKSIFRSVDMTFGHRWPILAVVGSWWLIEIVGVLITVRAFPFSQMLTRQLVTLVWNTPFSAYFAVMTTILYHDLRAAKEGIAIEQIAAVFD